MRFFVLTLLVSSSNFSHQDSGGQARVGDEGQGSIQEVDRPGSSFHST
jgi:hypothetical protein